ncbi:MAG TPA: MASE1 domain-containing protein [Actinomycetota bacterium]|nr:MASE1 domain-containing protein [Actinomycetota bacterium]
MVAEDDAVPESGIAPARAPFVLRLLVLAAVYLAAARFGIEQDVAHGVITPVWAPSGIAIATLLLWGRRYWIGIALGAFVANATSDISIAAAGAIALGNTLEAVAAATLLGRVDFSSSLTRVRDVLWFVVLAAMAATTVSATVGVTALEVMGELGSGGYAEEWVLWWFGDLIGALLVAPPILAWAAAVRDRRWPDRGLEGLVLAASVIVAAIVVFIGGSWRYPYVIFPLLIWAALRFRQLGATTAIALVGGIATWGTAGGAVPIGGASPTEAVQILQGLIAIVGVGTFVTAATISERDTAEADRTSALTQLRDRNAMYETVLQTVSDLGEGFLVTDAGRLIFANPAYCEMTGYTFDELLALPSLVELTAPEHRDEIAERLRQRMAGGKVMDHYESALIRKDGRRVEVEVAVEVAQTDQGPRIVSVVRDITERKRIESFREHFVSYAAHELRAPISNIAGFVDLLGNAVDKGDAKALVDRTATNVRTMQARLDNILALTRIERGDVPLKPEVVDVGRFLKGLAEGLTPPAGKHLEVDAAPGVEAWVDISALEQIVANLVTNAYRYGGDRVWVACRRADGVTAIEVTDDGAGIAGTEVENMFEPFVRGGPRGDSEGAGLGLPIVKALAIASGGNIRYWSEEGRASFVVSLPVSKGSSA